MPDMAADEVRATIDQLVEASAIVEARLGARPGRAGVPVELEMGPADRDDAFLRAGSRPHDARRIRGAAAPQGARRPAARFVSAQRRRRASCKRFPTRAKAIELIELMARRRTVRSAGTADDHAAAALGLPVCRDGHHRRDAELRRHAAARHDAVGRRPQSLRSLCLCA